MTLRLRAQETEQIHAHLSRAYPEEGCGVLLGRDRGDAREVARAVPIQNQREDSKGKRYLIAPEQFLAAEREARDTGLDVVGFFHSHPDHPARPSGFDLEHAWPFYSYMIVSVEHGQATDMRAWRLAEDRSGFEPETLEVLSEERTPGQDGDRRA
jgi:proteasome lid subunit RPN8/RPN11